MYFHIINGRPVSLVTKSIETNRRKTQQGDYIVPSHWPLSMSLNESPAPFMQKGGQQKDGGSVRSIIPNRCCSN